MFRKKHSEKGSREEEGLSLVVVEAQAGHCVLHSEVGVGADCDEVEGASGDVSDSAAVGAELGLEVDVVAEEDTVLVPSASVSRSMYWSVRMVKRDFLDMLMPEVKTGAVETLMLMMSEMLGKAPLGCLS